MNLQMAFGQAHVSLESRFLCSILESEMLVAGRVLQPYPKPGIFDSLGRMVFMVRYCLEFKDCK